MDEVLVVNKPLGITSYDVIRKLKKDYPGQKIGHAGTLDPLADGVLICLVGKDATKRQAEFMDVDKEYEFEVLFGFETDTYDILGLVNEVRYYDSKILLPPLHNLISDVKCDVDQPVPPFSAVKVNGKPLYRWYLDGKINEVEIPTKQIHIDSIEIQNIETISKEDLHVKINSLLETVKSGFRQKQVVTSWNETLSNSSQDQFLVAKIRATVSKGTYVRGIAHELGQKLKIGACTMSITRTKVGKFKIEDARIL